MPGIVGLVTQMPSEWAKPQLSRMLQSLCHGPSYVTGTWTDESLGIYVGWAARKGSLCDEMPLCNESGSVSLIFSGEEFSDPDTIERLKAKGQDASYLVRSYEEDPNFPAGLNGRFHGLAIDHTRGIATLFNDRYGTHRIYYHEAKEGLYFSAEAKAILAVRPELRSADPQGLGELVSLGCVLENRSLFKGVRVLPPGSVWTLAGGAVTKKAVYFDPSEWEQQAPLDPESYYQELRQVFSRNLPRYFKGRERIGLSLTGGLDTRMIMAWWKVQPGSIPCYTFRGIFRDCQDVIIARRVAQFCQQPHQEILLGKEFLSQFAHYAERSIYLTDGCVDVSRSPVLYTNERAAQIAPVRLTGNYGSEVLRRLVAFKPAEPPEGLFDSNLLPHVQEARRTYARLLQVHPVSFIAFRQVPWHHWGLLALEQTQLSPRSPYLDNDVVRTAFRVHDSSLAKGAIRADNDDCLRLISDGNLALSRIRSDRGLGGVGGLRSALSRAYLEATFKAEYEYDYGMPQWLAQLDHAVSWLHLERVFLGRHKYYHFRVWYRDALSKYVQEMLLDSRTLSRPYINRAALESMVHAHINGNRNYTVAITKTLTLELIHRLFLDGN